MSTDGEQGFDDDRIAVAEFALGVLNPAEHAAMSRRIASEPALQQELTLWQARFSTLDTEFAETPAPPQAWTAIERRLFGEPQRESGWWNSLVFWRGMAGACLAVAVVAIGATIMLPRPLPTGPELVAALEQEGSNVKFVAFYDERAGTVKLAALSGSAVPDKDFELWAIKGTAAPVSMGVIPVNAPSNISLDAALKSGFGAGTVLAVTLEPKGGSPSGAPTGPIVAKGAATQI